MRLSHEKREIQSQGVQSSGTYSMVLNGKTFEMMTSTLYKNKIGSIVREIGCNALDAHRMAGKENVPFLIHIPTAFEPWFTVQDFGTGLSAHNFEKVYKVLGESTKDGNNEDIGAFGLGAKTPYSYGEKSFLLINRHDGIEYQYSAFVDDENMPQLALMHKTETTECNGLTVKIPVESSDFWEFKKEINEQYKFFTLKPEIENTDVSFEWQQLDEPALVIGDVQIMNVDINAYHEKKIFVVQGPVGYSLMLSEIEDKITPENLKTLHLLKSSGAIITFEIGEIGVTISREDIDYKKTTIANIDAKLTIFRDNMKVHLAQKLDTVDSDWLRAIEINDSLTLQRLVEASSYEIPNTFKKGGRLTFDAVDGFTRVVEEECTQVDGTKFKSKKTLRDYKLVTYTRNFSNNNISMKTSKNPDELEAHRDTQKIYVRDTSSQPISRVKHEILKNDYSQVVVLTLGSDHKKTITTAFTDKEIKRISKMFGGIAMQRVSELAKPPVPIVSSANSDKTIGYMLLPHRIGYNSLNSTFDWERAKGLIEDIEPQIYVSVERYDIKSQYSVLKKYEQLIDAGLVDCTLYAFNPTNTAKIEEIDGWVKLEDFVEENYKKVEPLFGQFHEITLLEELRCRARINKSAVKSILEYSDLIESELALWYFKICKSIDKIYQWKKGKLSKTDQKFFKTFESQIEKSFNGDDNEHLNRIKEVRSKFRFLPEYNYYSQPSDDDIEHIIQYVNCMEKGA